MNNKMYAKQEMFKEPILYVDLNEQVDDDLYLLSKNDIKKNINHLDVNIGERMKIIIYMHDLDERNFSDDLYAYGIIEENNSGAFTHVSWLVRTENIKHLSEKGEYNEKK